MRLRLLLFFLCVARHYRSLRHSGNRLKFSPQITSLDQILAMNTRFSPAQERDGIVNRVNDERRSSRQRLYTFSQYC